MSYRGSCHYQMDAWPLVHAGMFPHLEEGLLVRFMRSHLDHHARIQA